MKYRRKQPDEYEFEPIPGSVLGHLRVWQLFPDGRRAWLGTIDAAGIAANYEPIPSEAAPSSESASRCTYVYPGDPCHRETVTGTARCDRHPPRIK